MIVIKRPLTVLATSAALATASLVAADQPVQGPTRIAPATDKGYTLGWDGVPGRTYFPQHSTDLQNWRYFPVVLAGEAAEQQWWFDSDAPRFFTRFRHTDIETPDPWGDDFDDDGFGNLEEVRWGADPFAPDTDGDGMPDGWEFASGTAILIADAGLDYDLDGLTNSQEWNMGLTPRGQDSLVLEWVGGHGQSLVCGSGVAATLYFRARTVTGAVMAGCPVTFGFSPHAGEIVGQWDDYQVPLTQTTSTTDANGLVGVRVRGHGSTLSSPSEELHVLARSGAAKAEGTVTILRDRDGDGISDMDEETSGTNPMDPDSDDDGLDDALDAHPLTNSLAGDPDNPTLPWGNGWLGLRSDFEVEVGSTGTEKHFDNLGASQSLDWLYTPVETPAIEDSALGGKGVNLEKSGPLVLKWGNTDADYDVFGETHSIAFWVKFPTAPPAPNGPPLRALTSEEAMTYASPFLTRGGITVSTQDPYQEWNGQMFGVRRISTTGAEFFFAEEINHFIWTDIGVGAEYQPRTQLWATDCTIYDGQWHHVAFVVHSAGSGTTCGDQSLYLDGVPLTASIQAEQGGASGTLVTVDETTGTRLVIGSSRTHAEPLPLRCHASLDRLLLYSKELPGQYVTLLYNQDNDGDGIADRADPDDSINSTIVTGSAYLDKDGDGMPDTWEMSNGPAVNELVADGHLDPDNDGLDNHQEMVMGTWPNHPDYDNDKLPDGWEVSWGLNPKVADATTVDADGDGLTLIDEYRLHGNPFAADGETSGTTGQPARGWNGDGLDDWYEVMHGLDPEGAAEAAAPGFMRDGVSFGIARERALQWADAPDSDGDGLSDPIEELWQTSPLDTDSDHDGLPDGYEIACGLSPLQAAGPTSDSDNDGVADSVELAHGGLPYDADTDADGLTDGWESAHGYNAYTATGGLVLFHNFNQIGGGNGMRRVYDSASPVLVPGDAADGNLRGNASLAVQTGAEQWRDSVLSLDGQDAYAAIPDHPVLGLQGDFTLAMWVKNEATYPLHETKLLEKRGAWSLHLAASRQPFFKWTDTTGEHTLVATTHIPTSGWSLLVVRRNAATGVMDIRIGNGSITTQAGTSAPNVTDWPLWAGGHRNIPATAFKGQVDDLRIYDLPLADADISLLATPLAAGWERNLDPDNDGVKNLDEQAIGGNPNVADTDGDGLTDLQEKSAGTMAYAADSDGDGIGDAVENAPGGSSPTSVDTDSDGLPDAMELALGTQAADPDTDNDGLPDGWEHARGLNPLSSADGNHDPDTDGLTNFQEYQADTAWDYNDDADGDGLSDQIEVEVWFTLPLMADTDNDGIDDGWEVAHNLNPLSVADGGLPVPGGNGQTWLQKYLDEGNSLPSGPQGARNRDSDGDGLTDYEETVIHHTNPDNPDTYGDGLGDGNRVRHGLLPPDGVLANHPEMAADADADGDGISNAAEVAEGTSPSIVGNMGCALHSLHTLRKVETIESSQISDEEDLYTVFDTADATLYLPDNARVVLHDPAADNALVIHKLELTGIGRDGKEQKLVLSLTGSQFDIPGKHLGSPPTAAYTPGPGADISAFVANLRRDNLDRVSIHSRLLAARKIEDPLEEIEPDAPDDPGQGIPGRIGGGSVIWVGGVWGASGEAWWSSTRSPGTGLYLAAWLNLPAAPEPLEPQEKEEPYPDAYGSMPVSLFASAVDLDVQPAGVVNVLREEEENARAARATLIDAAATVSPDDTHATLLVHPTGIDGATRALTWDPARVRVSDGGTWLAPGATMPESRGMVWLHVWLVAGTSGIGSTATVTMEATAAGQSQGSDSITLASIPCEFSLYPDEPVDVEADNAAFPVVAQVQVESGTDDPDTGLPMLAPASDGTVIAWELVDAPSGTSLRSAQSTTTNGLASVIIDLPRAAGAVVRVRAKVATLLDGTTSTDTGAVATPANGLILTSPEIRIVPGKCDTIALATNPEKYPMDGTSEMTISATASDAQGNLLPAETAAGWAFSGDGELITEEDELDGSGSARITVKARDLAQPTFAQNISATVHDRTEAMGIGNVPLTGFPEIIGSPEIDIHDPGSLATREIRVRFTGRDTAVDPDTPVIWHCSNGTLLPEELTLGPDGIAIAHITSQNAHVGPTLIYAQAGNAKVWIDSVQFTPGDGAWVEVTNPLLADSSQTVTVEGIAADKQITVTRTSMITVHGTAGARMRVGFRQPADTRDGRFAAPGPLQQPGWYGEALRIVPMSGGPALATDGTFTMPSSGLAGFTLESNGPPAGETSVIALVSAVILQTPAGGGEIELPVAPALVASTSAKVAAGIFDVAQCLVTGQPQTVTGHATDIGVSCLPVWGDGRDIILNVGRRFRCGGEDEEATLANLELTFATIGLISDLPILNVSTGPAAAIAKDIIKVTRQLCKRLQYGAPVMFLAYTDFARKLPAILASKIGLSIGATDDIIEQLKAMLRSMQHLNGLTDEELEGLDAVFRLVAKDKGPQLLRNIGENFGDEASQLLYKRIGVLALQKPRAAKRTTRMLAQIINSEKNAAFVGMVKGLDTADTADFVSRLGRLFDANDVIDAKDAIVGRDTARFRRMMEQRLVFDASAYSGLAFSPARKGLKELLQDFEAIRDLKGGPAQIRRCTIANRNFALGFRGEIDEALNLVGANVTGLNFGRWINWDSTLLSRKTWTDVDFVYNNVAYFRKSSVAELERVDPDRLVEIITFTKAQLALQHGIAVEKIVFKIPGGDALQQTNKTLYDYLQAAGVKAQTPVTFEDIVKIAPYP